MASYIEALLKPKKFDLDERSRIDQTVSQVLLHNLDSDTNMKRPKWLKGLHLEVIPR